MPFDALIDENGNVFPNPVNNFNASHPFVFAGAKTGRTEKDGFLVLDRPSLEKLALA